MADEDQKARNEKPFNPDKIEGVDKKNRKKIRNMVDKYGLITISDYDKKTSDNAWLLIQHLTVDDIDLMKNYLKLMKENQEDINKRHIPYLEDRINMYLDRPQVYGTQTTWDENSKSLLFHEIKDIKDIDKLRGEYNLKPLREYIKIMQESSEFPLTAPDGYK